MIKLSIIVCTHNRAPLISGCLDSIAESLANAQLVSAEIIVVDNASTDNTSDIVEAWAEKSHDFSVSLVHEPKKGLSVARNCGLGKAQGEYIAFTDDDCRLAPDYVRDLLKHFSDDTGPTLRGGRVELGDPLDLPLTIKTDDEKADYVHPTHPAGFIHGANMAMSRRVMERVGFFDEQFGAGTKFPGEDCDYIIRAHTAGLRVQYVPDMIVKHFHGRRSKDEAQKLFAGYMRANGALYIKHLRSSPLLIRHFWWDIKHWYKEMRGKSIKIMDSVDIGHRQVVFGNIAGMTSFIGVQSRVYISGWLPRFLKSS